MVQCLETFNMYAWKCIWVQEKWIRENYVIVKFNTFCIYTDNNSSKILFSAVLFFPNSMWLSCWIQIPPLGNGLVLIDDFALNSMLGENW